MDSVVCRKCCVELDILTWPHELLDVKVWACGKCRYKRYDGVKTAQDVDRVKEQVETDTVTQYLELRVDYIGIGQVIALEGLLRAGAGRWYEITIGKNQSELKSDWSYFSAESLIRVLDATTPQPRPNVYSLYSGFHLRLERLFLCKHEIKEIKDRWDLSYLKAMQEGLYSTWPVHTVTLTSCWTSSGAVSYFARVFEQWKSLERLHFVDIDTTEKDKSVLQLAMSARCRRKTLDIRWGCVGACMTPPHVLLGAKGAEYLTSICLESMNGFAVDEARLPSVCKFLKESTALTELTLTVAKGLSLDPIVSALHGNHTLKEFVALSENGWEATDVALSKEGWEGLLQLTKQCDSVLHHITLPSVILPNTTETTAIARHLEFNLYFQYFAEEEKACMEENTLQHLVSYVGRIHEDNKPFELKALYTGLYPEERPLCAVSKGELQTTMRFHVVSKHWLRYLFSDTDDQKEHAGIERSTKRQLLAMGPTPTKKGRYIPSLVSP